MSANSKIYAASLAANNEKGDLINIVLIKDVINLDLFKQQCEMILQEKCPLDKGYKNHNVVVIKYQNSQI